MRRLQGLSLNDITYSRAKEEYTKIWVAFFMQGRRGMVGASNTLEDIGAFAAQHAEVEDRESKETLGIFLYARS